MIASLRGKLQNLKVKIVIKIFKKIKTFLLKKIALKKKDIQKHRFLIIVYKKFMLIKKPNLNLCKKELNKKKGSLDFLL